MEKGLVLVIGVIIFLILLGFVYDIPKEFGLIYLIVIVLFLVSILRYVLS